ncbi:hypothetical protein RN001_004050 [Aquatica leii]|uniref:Barrier-to-autointegration factor n=1 Tax=Aquatica leii TaxID=1421715 RepID=A0AAN7Q6Y2_9COLE|nr:hypothetical protein RN001_004050 [Aquatica leii]
MQARRNISDEPMEDKPTNALPGIGDILSKRMKEQGFEKASQIYGQFLVLNRDYVRFENWMRENFEADRNNATKCYDALDLYFRNFGQK